MSARSASSETTRSASPRTHLARMSTHRPRTHASHARSDACELRRPRLHSTQITAPLTDCSLVSSARFSCRYPLPRTLYLLSRAEAALSSPIPCVAHGPASRTPRARCACNAHQCAAASLLVALSLSANADGLCLSLRLQALRRPRKGLLATSTSTMRLGCASSPELTPSPVPSALPLRHCLIHLLAGLTSSRCLRIPHGSRPILPLPDFSRRLTRTGLALSVYRLSEYDEA